jgi:hypothetical protein
VRSLGTAQGWKNIGQGFVNFAEMANIYSVDGLIMRTQLGMAVNDYVTNIPNMSAYELGHDSGFLFEKVLEIALVSRGASLTVNAVRGADDVVNVFRVYGGKAKPGGFSWTPVNPNSVGNFRNAAGLPNVNTGRFVIEGTVKRSSIIKSRSALPLDGNKGGLLEYIIDPKNVNIHRVSGVNPGF